MYNLARLDTCLVKASPFNGFCKARILWNAPYVNQHARPVFGAIGATEPRYLR